MISNAHFKGANPQNNSTYHAAQASAVLTKGQNHHQ